jgi:uncharacterized protein (DUF1499 family)
VRAAGWGALVGLIILAGMVLDGHVLRWLLPVGTVPPVDFRTLAPGPAPNHYLVCPNDLCTAAADRTSPIFDAPVDRLAAAWTALMAGAPRVELLRDDSVVAGQRDYVQRTRVLRFPDLVTVRFLAVDERRSTLAIYSRSIYGRSDFGVNGRRVEAWLAALARLLGA